MNELAQVIHDLVTRRPDVPARLHSDLSPEERAALEDLQALLTKSPSELAELLVQLGPTAEWWLGAPPVADNSAQP